jgi:hypothetical protein
MTLPGARVVAPSRFVVVMRWGAAGGSVGGRSRSVGATLLAGVVALGMACAADDTDGSQASDTPGPDSNGTDTLSPEVEVEAAYLAYWEMLDRLAEAPDPDDPEILERASGEALFEVVAGVTTLVERGHISDSGPLYAHSVESVVVRDNEAVLRDCVVDDTSLVDRATGEVVESGEIAVALLEVTLLLEDERWKVNRVQRIPVEATAISCEE